MRVPTVLAILALLLGAGCREPARPAGEIPTLSLPTYDGQTYTVSPRDDQVTLLVFWATWCQPCLMEIPSLIELHRKYADRRFRVVGVNTDDPEGAKARAILKRFGVNFPSLIGSDRTAQGFGGLYALPTSLLIGRDGKLKEKFVGLHPPDEVEAKVAAEL